MSTQSDEIELRATRVLEFVEGSLPAHFDTSAGRSALADLQALAGGPLARRLAVAVRIFELEGLPTAAAHARKLLGQLEEAGSLG